MAEQIQNDLSDILATEASDPRLESVTILAHNDYAEIDASYAEGEEVREQISQILEEMTPLIEDPDKRKKLGQLRQFDARFDLLHFEQIVDTFASEEDEEDEADEILDPSALLLVLGSSPE